MKQKINLLVTLTFLLPFSVFAQNEWAKNIGGTNLDQGTNVVMDNAGNLFFTGFFQGSVDFDPSANVALLTSVGNRDFFIAKYDGQGNFVWAKSIGGSDHDHGRTIRLDPIGNIYIAGDFSSVIDFDPGIGFSLKASSGGSDVFIAKYDPQGAFIWAKTVGGIGVETCRDMILDGNDNAYIVGTFQGTADFDPNGGMYNLASTGGVNAFMLKLDNMGNLVWANVLEGSSNNFINKITMNTQGDLCVVGDFQGTTDFDFAPSATSNLTSIGNYSAFFARYSKNGQLRMVKMIGGSGYEKGKDIVTDNQNCIYVTGGFRGVIDFDPSSASTFATSAGVQDLFLAKYSPNGDLHWVNRIGGAGDDGGVCLTIDNNSSVYVGGYFNQSISLEGGATLTSSGASDIVIAKYDSEGRFLYAKKNGGVAGEEPSALSADNYSNVYATGWMQGSSTFGSTTLNSQGDRDMFMARVNLNAPVATSPIFEEANTVQIFPNPNMGDFTVEIEMVENIEKMTISIHDVTGRVVEKMDFELSGVVGRFEHRFDVSDRVSNGFYFVRIKAGSQIVTRKILVCQ